MRKIFPIVISLLFSFNILAQINAVTENGDAVLLYQDGTWSYLDNSMTSIEEIPLSEMKFLKSKESSFLVKSKNINIGIWINPKEWTFSKSVDNEDAEFEFSKKGEDLYGMLISEKIEIPVATLKNIAVENARGAIPDIKIMKEEFRMVNGVKVLMLQMGGTIQGMKIVYYGYYYSNSKGTVQLLTYTGQNLFAEYLPVIEMFLNGFVEL